MEKIFLKSDLGKSFEDYDFPGLKNSLKMEQTQVVNKIKESVLKGRGGAGFPAGIKWETAYHVEDDVSLLFVMLMKVNPEPSKIDF